MHCKGYRDAAAKVDPSAPVMTIGCRIHTGRSRAKEKPKCASL